MNDFRQRLRVIEYVCDGVLLARYHVRERAPFAVKPYVPWPKGTEIRTWTDGDADQPEVVPVYPP